MTPQELHAAALALALDRGDRELFDRLRKMAPEEIAKAFDALAAKESKTPSLFD